MQSCSGCTRAPPKLEEEVPGRAPAKPCCALHLPAAAFESPPNRGAAASGLRTPPPSSPLLLPSPDLTPAAPRLFAEKRKREGEREEGREERSSKGRRKEKGKRKGKNEQKKREERERNKKRNKKEVKENIIPSSAKEGWRSGNK